jgi:glycosyltransferase involved in cell wall biosynthesis
VVVPSQYEGDGMVVIEAILSGIPLVLADNEDLRRFKLDNKHYFGSCEQLIEIIDNNIKSEFQDLLVSSEVYDILIRERSISNITDKWISTLNLLKFNKPMT